MDDIDFNVGGLGDLEEKLAQLGRKSGQKAMRSSLMFATTPLWKDIKNVAPYDPPPDGDRGGHINENIVRRNRVGKGGATIHQRLGEPTEAQAERKGYELHGTVLELGSYDGTKPAQPFMRPTFERSVPEVLSRFAKKFAKVLE